MVELGQKIEAELDLITHKKPAVQQQMRTRKLNEILGLKYQEVSTRKFADPAALVSR